MSDWQSDAVIRLTQREASASISAAPAVVRVGRVLRPSTRTGGSASYYDVLLLDNDHIPVQVGVNGDRAVYGYAYGCVAPAATTLAAGTVVSLYPAAGSAGLSAGASATYETTTAAYDVRRVTAYWLIISGIGSGYIEGAIAD